MKPSRYIRAVTPRRALGRSAKRGNSSKPHPRGVRVLKATRKPPRYYTAAWALDPGVATPLVALARNRNINNTPTNRRAAPMDMPPATQGRRVSAVVERNLDELCASLDDALSSRQRSPYAEKQLRDKIKAKTDFLRPLLSAEAECHGGARQVRLAEAEARFAVLKATFDQWAQRAVVATPEPVEEEEEEEVEEPEEEEADYSGSSRSTCSCTDSCQEATEGNDAKREDVVEARNEEGASDVIAEDNDAEGETAETRREEATDTVAKKREAMGIREEVTLDAIAKERDTDREAAAETGKRAVQRRWWRQSAAAWCGAACVVAVVAVGLAVELVAVDHRNVNVYVVPT
ncbi:uncharacterized protein [Miscanthus floridulus]|uniref:uncharacterized protein n=1 Tax=Miscanthus floridulus TaxID=154761 RepID=UPI00345AD415